LVNLTNFCAARAGTKMSCPDASEALCLIANYILHTLWKQNPWDYHKIFKHFEKTGLLRQVIRCVTHPPSSQQDTNTLQILRMLDILMLCPSLIKEKLCKGTSTGDLLINVVNGLDGNNHQRPVEVQKRLKNSMRMATVSNLRSHESSISLSMCRKCSSRNHDHEKLLVCSRCKTAYYWRLPKRYPLACVCGFQHHTSSAFPGNKDPILLLVDPSDYEEDHYSQATQSWHTTPNYTPAATSAR
jgi:hypothetical protein